MTRLLDARSSQNASKTGSIAYGFPNSIPQPFARIGLLTDGAGENLRVLLKGTVTVEVPFVGGIAASYTITIVRGELATDPVIYSSTATYDFTPESPKVITFSASDFNPPFLPQLTYTAFVSAGQAPSFRVGPENLDGFVVSD